MPQWLRRRAEIIELHDGVCQHCVTKKHALTIHHRYYVAERMAWEYPDWALIPVCDSPCHAQIQEDNRDVFAMWETRGKLLDNLCCPSEIAELSELLDRALMSGVKIETLSNLITGTYQKEER